MLEGRNEKGNKQEVEIEMNMAKIAFLSLSPLLAQPAMADEFQQGRGVICRKLESAEAYRKEVMRTQNLIEALFAANTIKENGVGSCQYAVFVGKLGEDLLPIVDDHNYMSVITKVTVRSIIIGLGVTYDFPTDDRQRYTVRVLNGQAL